MVCWKKNDKIIISQQQNAQLKHVGDSYQIAMKMGR